MSQLFCKLFFSILHLIIEIIKNVFSFFYHSLPLILSIFTALVLGIRFFRERAAIKISLGYSNMNAVLLLPKRLTSTDPVPDPYSYYKYRVILDIVIENQSVLPIAILSISLNDLGNSYTKYMKPGKYTVHVLGYGKKHEDITFTFDTSGDYKLNLPMNLGPYEMVNAYVTFLVEEENEINFNTDNLLKIFTSRKTFTEKISISKKLIDEETNNNIDEIFPQGTKYNEL